MQTWWMCVSLSGSRCGCNDVLGGLLAQWMVIGLLWLLICSCCSVARLLVGNGVWKIKTNISMSKIRKGETGMQGAKKMGGGQKLKQK
uniref:Uncharacterized protein n=1 Tax=Caenorhabditis japonica TaxID=281687 RepID=A0A8R1IIT2_CAEJA